MHRQLATRMKRRRENGTKPRASGNRHRDGCDAHRKLELVPVQDTATRSESDAKSESEMTGERAKARE